MTINSAVDERALLATGFFLIGLGNVVAYQNPAIEYEPSIYTGTPLVFWIGCLIALFAAAVTTFSSSTDQIRRLGVVLGGLALMSVVALPIVRGYHYLGEGDALTHLGSARSLAAGALAMHELRYPAVHSLGVIVGRISGIELTHSLLLFVPVFVLCFFVFIPLSVKALTDSSIATKIGIFSGLLLLPLNFLGVHMQIHPTSQAIMFAPLLLFLFIVIYKRRTWQFVALFTIVATMFVMLHPQQAANFVLFFGTVAAVQLIHFLGRNHMRLQPRKSIFAPVATLTVLFWLWAQNLPAFESSLGSVIVNLLLREVGTATQVASRGLSLEQLGGSLEGVFIRLFVVALLYCIVTGLLMGAVLAKTVGLPYTERLHGVLTSPDRDEQTLVLYFTFGFVTIFGLFFAYVLGNITSQYFRHYGFMMVIVSVLGAAALGRMYSSLNTRIDGKRAKTFCVAIFFILILVSVPVVYPSPYIFQTSGHVTEAQMHGYEQAFDHGHEDITYDHVRSSASRYGNAIKGPTEKDRRKYYREGVRQGGVPDHFADRGLEEYFDEPVYLTITEADRIRDPVVWQGFRFSHEDFAYLDNDQHINKVYSNGGFDLYLVNPE